MKKIMLISSIILTIVVISMITINNRDKNEKNIIKSKEEEKEIVNSNMLTLMYETEAGSKEYVATKDNTWPEEGYIFNKNLSGCENGGELEYNSQNNTVNLLTNKSDKCYVYFDKYNGVWIDNVIATNITGSSITIDISATSENGSISKYYYQVNESEYIESSNKVITIEDLNKLTEYKIEVYAVDSTNAKSNIYELNVSTTDISIPIINSVVASDITTSGFTLTVNATSDVEIERYYYIIEIKDIAGTSTNNTYTFDELNASTTYNITVFVVDNNDNKSNNYSISIETESLLLLADWVIEQYGGVQGNNGIYHHTSSLPNSATDNSYRYAGANPNNYICFGSDATTCPDDNLYRIIGVFGDKVKLIKLTSYGRYVWDSGNNNTWDSSTKPDIYTTLNTTYLNNLENTWNSMIATNSYEVGGMATSSTYTAKQYYDVEVGTSQSGYTETMKIGLMYVSDYGFAASNSYWTSTLKNYNDSSIRSNNWMYSGSWEWTISRYLSSQYPIYYAIPVNSIGNVSTIDGVTASYVIRPVFYLKSDVLYASGSGTESDPFRIK